MHWLCDMCKERALQYDVNRRMGDELRDAGEPVEAARKTAVREVHATAVAHNLTRVMTAEMAETAATEARVGCRLDDREAGWWAKASARVKPRCPQCRHTVWHTVTNGAEAW
jgi:hypothetical protein